jgi:hypothetical protein
MKNLPQMERPTFDEFLKLDRHLSAVVDVRNRTKRTATMRASGKWVDFGFHKKRLRLRERGHLTSKIACGDGD